MYACIYIHTKYTFDIYSIHIYIYVRLLILFQDTPIHAPCVQSPRHEINSKPGWFRATGTLRIDRWLLDISKPWSSPLIAGLTRGSVS